MCRRARDWVARRAPEDAVLLLPCQSGKLSDAVPQVTPEECMRAMVLVLSDGRTVSGADALARLLTFIPRWRWAGGLLALPGIRLLARFAYARIARNRAALSAFFADKAGHVCQNTEECD